MSMAMTTSLPKHTSATLNRFLGKLNGYEPELLIMIFEMVFVLVKEVKEAIDLLGMYMTLQCL